MLRGWEVVSVPWLVFASKYSDFPDAIIHHLLLKTLCKLALLPEREKSKAVPETHYSVFGSENTNKDLTEYHDNKI